MKIPFTLVADAADILDVGERQVQRLVSLKRLGKARKPTKAEQAKYGLPPHQLILDGDKVNQLKEKRENSRTDRRIRVARQASVRQGRARRATRKKSARR